MRKFWCGHLLEDSFVLVHGMNKAGVEPLEGVVDRSEDGEGSSCFQLLSETRPLRHLEEARHFCRTRVATAPSTSPGSFCSSSTILPAKAPWMASAKTTKFILKQAE